MIVENLLHAHIVLSKREVAKLREVAFEDSFGAGREPFGTITFLGNTAGTVHLLLRFPKKEYGLPWVPLAIKEVFGVNEITEFYGDADGFDSDRRVLVVARYSPPLMDPHGYIRVKAKHLAATAVRIFVGRVHGERTPEELHRNSLLPPI